MRLRWARLAQMVRWLLALILLTAALAACQTEEATPSAKFPVGSRVRFVGDTESIILYIDCGSVINKIAGVANMDDAAVTLDRKYCDGRWWYQVQVPALKDEDWKGIGWAAEENLKAK
ncbi:MAG: hypothetical protein FJ030_06630 [Chloroflexi bacterium]|nr:hypothetical protein [Chloroflexota bacterium]